MKILKKGGGVVEKRGGGGNVYFHSVRTKTSIKLTFKYHLSHLISSTK
jgi:hypothetical protein